MKNFKRRIKIFTFFASCFLLIVLTSAVIYNVKIKNWFNIFLVFISIIFFAAITIFLFIYYKNVVIEVSFIGDNAVIKTHSKIYTLPCSNFTEVNDVKWQGRIFISYKDDIFKKRFIFQKRYSPFKSHSLNINEMKTKMIFAVFKET